MTNYLYQYKDVKKEIEHVKEEIHRLESRMYSPRMGVISDMPKGSGPVGDQMAENFIKFEKLLEKYNALLDKLCDQQLKIEEFIETLEPIERDLIRYRYIDGLRWRHVFKKIGYSQKQTFRIHNGILEKLDRLSESDNK